MERLTCGICTGGVRLYEGTLHGRPITDWKHTDVPPDTEPHRPVLGTPVDQETLDRLHTEREEKPVAIPVSPVSIESVPVNPSDLPDPAKNLVTLAKEYGWVVQRKPLITELPGGRRVVGVAMRRDDLGFVAFWRFEKNKWSFDAAYKTLNGRVRAEQVGSNSLKEWIKQLRVTCPVCNHSEIAANHEECV